MLLFALPANLLANRNAARGFEACGRKKGGHPLTGPRTTLQLPVPSGIYWARLQIAGQQPEHHKIIVSR